MAETPQTLSAVPGFLARLNLPRGLGTQPDPISPTPTPKSQFEATARRNAPQQGSKMPTYIAIAAAANGNFGPLAQLYEQKRRTQIAQTVGPILRTVDALITDGEFDEAEKVLVNKMSGISARFPELAQIQQGVASTILQKRRDRNAFKTTLRMFKAATKGKTDIPEDIVRFVGELEAMDSGNFTPSPAVIQQLVNFIKPHTQMLQAQGLRMGTFGGVTGQAYPQVMQADQLKNPAVPAALARLDPPLTVDQALTIANNPNHPRSQLVQRTVAQANIQTQRLAIGSAIPMSEEMARELGILGATQEQIAMRAPPIPVMIAARENVNRNLIDRAEAPMLAQAKLPPGLTSQGTVVVINSDPNDPNYGQVNTDYSYNKASKDPSSAILSTQFNQEVVRPSILAITGLDAVESMFDSQIKEGSLIEGAWRRLGAWFGIDMTGDTTISEAYELIATRAIEAVENTGAISDRRVGDNKALIAGKFADREQSARAIEALQGRLRLQLNLYINQNKRKLGPRVSTPPLPRPTVLPGAPPTPKLPVGLTGMFPVSPVTPITPPLTTPGGLLLKKHRGTP